MSIMSHPLRQAGLESLPPLRDDVRRPELSAEALIRDRVFIVANFLSAEEAERVRRNARNVLTVHAPIRAFRKLLETQISNPDDLPRILQRRPLQLPTHSPIFSAATRKAIARIESLNNELYQIPEVAEIYGQEAHLVTHGLFVRVRKGRAFDRHQDSLGCRGFGFSIQTSPTVWHLEPSLTDPDQEDFTAQTQPGDLVVIRERAGSLENDSIPIGYGFDQFDPRGSIVHTGYNTSGRMRYSLNLFSTEIMEG